MRTFQKVAAAALAILGVATPRAWAQEPATIVTVTIPATAYNGAPLEGRLILLASRDLKREPRSHVSPDEPLDAPFMFGVNVQGLTGG